MTANQINYARMKEDTRHNVATEAENYRSNVARETENTRHNVATETETHRSNVAQEALGWANVAIGRQNAQSNAIQAAAATKQAQNAQTANVIRNLEYKVKREEQDRKNAESASKETRGWVNTFIEAADTILSGTKSMNRFNFIK